MHFSSSCTRLVSFSNAACRTSLNGCESGFSRRISSVHHFSYICVGAQAPRRGLRVLWGEDATVRSQGFVILRHPCATTEFTVCEVYETTEQNFCSLNTFSVTRAIKRALRIQLAKSIKACVIRVSEISETQSTFS